MKKQILAAVLFFVGIATAQLSGSYTVGTGGNYDSLGAAIAALNTNGVNGAVTMLLLNGTHNVGQNVSLGCTGTSETNTITFKPDAGATVTINFLDGTASQNIDGHWVIGSATYTSAALVSTNYVTIDGSNNGTTSKDLTINGPVTASQRSVIRIFGNNDHITIKNCIITNNSTSGSSTAPINVTNYFSSPTNYSPDYLTVQNNTLNSVSGNGSTVLHLANSGSPTVGTTGLVIRDNIMFGRQRGMFISYTNDGDIYGNTISEISQASQGSAAITLQTNFASAGTFNVYNNKITALTTLNATAGASNGVIGIDNQCLSPKVVNIYNNMIGGMGPGSAAATNSKIYGIRTNNSSTCNIYYNTIHIPEKTDMTTFGTSYIAGIVYASTAEAGPVTGGSATLKNNIIISEETGMKTWGIRRVGTSGTFTSNNNNIYRSDVTNGFVGFFNASDASDLAAWQTASSQDASSKSVSVTFISGTDLHLGTGSNGDVNLIGVTGLGISTDIDGATRSGTYPYMGADEASTPLPVELTSFTAVAKGKNVELKWSTATETNNHGFDIERSVNGTWTKIGFVEGAGSTNAPKEYGYVDAVNQGGRISYRLKQIDRDGKFTYNNAIEVVVTLEARSYDLAQNFPNPFNPVTTIRFSVKQLEQASVRVYDVTGKQVAELFNGVASPGQVYNVQFNGAGLASGMYLYVLQTPTAREVRKMTLLK